MKTKVMATIVTVIGVLYLGSASVKASIPIDKRTFPDPTFRETVKSSEPKKSYLAAFLQQIWFIMV